MSLLPDDIQEAFDGALDDSLDILEALVEINAPDGLTFGEDKMDDREFAAFYLELKTTPHPEFNTLQYLPQVSPPVYEAIERRHQRLVSKGVA